MDIHLILCTNRSYMYLNDKKRSEVSLSIERVIEEFENIGKNIEFYQTIGGGIIIACAIIVVAGLLTFNYFDNKGDVKKIKWTLGLTMSLLIGLLSIAVFYLVPSNREEKAKYGSWETDYLYPYLKEQKEEQVNVIDYTYEKIEGFEGEGSNKFEIDVEYKNQSNELVNIQLEAKVVVENIEKPYLTYKKLQVSISDKYNSDHLYEAVLHIPESK